MSPSTVSGTRFRGRCPRLFVGQLPGSTDTAIAIGLPDAGSIPALAANKPLVMARPVADVADAATASWMPARHRPAAGTGDSVEHRMPEISGTGCPPTPFPNRMAA